MLTIDDIIERNNDDSLVISGQGAEKQKNEKIAKKYVIRNLSDEVMHTISPSDSFIKLLEKLNAAYGFANMDPSVIEAKLRNISFNPDQNPSIMLNQIDIWTAELESAGGAITDGRLVQLLVDGLTGNPFKDNFWFNCRGQMMLKGLKNYKYDSAAKFISQYWYAYKPIKKHETANGAFEKRLCDHCKSAKRTRIMKTHNTADCRGCNRFRLLYSILSSLQISLTRRLTVCAAQPFTTSPGYFSFNNSQARFILAALSVTIETTFSGPPRSLIMLSNAAATLKPVCASSPVLIVLKSSGLELFAILKFT
jgi:hypothetical protein